MNRKDKTVKQLQAECRKRKVGFMMNWTKVALVKRLEDEDTRDESVLKLREALDNSKKQLTNLQGTKDKSREIMVEKLAKREKEISETLATLSPAQIKKDEVEKMKLANKRKLNSLQSKFDKLHTEQQELKAKILSIGDEKLILIKEIASLKT